MPASWEQGAEIEHAVEQCVCAVLHVGSHELHDGYLIADDTVDSLTVLELVVAVEDALGIVVPEQEVPRLRTYGDLRCLALRESGAAHPRPAPPAGRRRHGLAGYERGTVVIQTGSLTRAMELTPYGAETILEDALAAAPAAAVDLFVAPATSDAVVAELERAFDALRRRGVEVHVTRKAPSLLVPDARRAEVI